MISNDERREVAARLRTIAYGCQYEEQFYEILQETVMNDEEFHSYVDVANRLAGLIEQEPERTCHVAQAYFHDCSELDNLMEGIAFSPEDTVACICDPCGMNWRFDRGIRPNYCPYCGAKVIGG